MKVNSKQSVQDMSMEAWNLGYSEIELMEEMHHNDDDTPEQDARREKRNELINQLRSMDATQLRAYVDGMRARVGEILW